MKNSPEYFFYKYSGLFSLTTISPAALSPPYSNGETQ